MSKNLKTLFLIHLIVAVVFGLPLLVAPAVYLQIFGSKPGGEEGYRLLGGAILAFGFSSWLAYKENAWEHIKLIVQVEVFWTILATLILLYGILLAGLPATAWINAVIMAAFAVFFSLFYFRRA
jgi:hypothetical protein